MKRFTRHDEHDWGEDGQLTEALIFETKRGRLPARAGVRAVFLGLAAMAGLLTAATLGLAQLGPAHVAVDRQARFQTIVGWPAPDALGEDGLVGLPVSTALAAEILDDAVQTLGLTGATVIDGVGQSEPKNDNSDPYAENAAGFDWRVIDAEAASTVLPLRQRVGQLGDRFSLWLRFPVATDGAMQGQWIIANPAEYAEHATAVLNRLRTTHGLAADGWAVDAGLGASGGDVDAARFSAAASAAGRALASAGFPDRLVLPDGTNPQGGWELVEALQNDAEIWGQVGLLSWQLRGAVDPFRERMRALAQTKGVGTAQIGNDGADVLSLYVDLAVGGASLWVPGSRLVTMGTPTGGALYGVVPRGTSFRRNALFWKLRQILRYVRPGMTRVAAVSDQPALRALAFDAPDGRSVIVLIHNDAAAGAPIDATVEGLPEGRYGVSVTDAAGYKELGTRQVTKLAPLTVQVPRGGALTLYGLGPANLPPTLVRWDANPEIVVRPANSVTLSAAAEDPEGDPLRYTWSVASQPAGAKAILGAANSATGVAAGLTVVGRYAFAIQVSDGPNTVKRTVYVDVVDGNQPPVWAERTVIGGSRQLVPGPIRAFASAFDPENDPLTWTWRLVSQPPGGTATAKWESVTSSSQLQLIDVSAAGRYELEAAVSDGHSRITWAFAIEVRPSDGQPPVITSAAAQPDQLLLPDKQTRLVAQAYDPDGGAPSFWWSIASAPPDARPVLTRPGAPDARVDGLYTPGQYVFRVTVADELNRVSRDVTVTVISNEPTPTVPVGGRTPTARPSPGTPTATPRVTATPGPGNNRRRIYVPRISKQHVLRR